MDDKNNKVLNMKPKKKKNNLKKRHILIIGVLVYLLVFFTFQTFQIISLKKQERQQSQKLQALEQTKASYQEQLDQVNSPEYIEKIARENLRMIRPGEILYVDEDFDEEEEDKLNEESGEELEIEEYEDKND